MITDCADFGDLWFYLANFLAICFETAIVLLSRRALKTRTNEDVTGAARKSTLETQQTTKDASSPSQVQLTAKASQHELEYPAMWKRVLGYVWVLAFFCWVIPKCSYARMERQMKHQG